jgi:hypothetical protein
MLTEDWSRKRYLSDIGMAVNGIRYRTICFPVEHALWAMTALLAVL